MAYGNGACCFYASEPPVYVCVSMSLHLAGEARVRASPRLADGLGPLALRLVVVVLTKDGTGSRQPFNLTFSRREIRRRWRSKL